jgi:hypothetical protein
MQGSHEKYREVDGHQESSYQGIQEPPAEDDIFAAVAAADEERVTRLLAGFPDRATQSRPTDGYTPLHVAADVRTQDADTDRLLATIMFIILGTQSAHGHADPRALDFQDRTPDELLHMQGSDYLIDARSEYLDHVARL